MRVARRPSDRVNEATARTHHVRVSRVRESTNDTMLSTGCVRSHASALMPASKALSSRITRFGKESCVPRAAGATTMTAPSAGACRLTSDSRARAAERQPPRQDADPSALPLPPRHRHVDKIESDPREPAGALAPRQRAEHQPGLAEPRRPAAGVALRQRERARAARVRGAPVGARALEIALAADLAP